MKTVLKKSIARILCLVLSMALNLNLFASPTSFAAVGVSSFELQEAIDILFPSGDKLPTLKGYSAFSLIETRPLEGGIEGTYEARLLANPWLEIGIPQITVQIFAYNSQAAALTAFDAVRGEKNARWAVRQEDDDTLELTHVNGNLFFILNYTDAPDLDGNSQFVTELIENMKLATAVLFPPSNAELLTRSERSSVKLNDLYVIPRNGQIQFDLYVNELEGAVGTVLDSSGINDAKPGDLYLYLHSNGRLFAGIFAPDFDSACTQEAGWYRIETKEAIHPYEWNAVQLKYGATGFELSLNGESLASCDVAQSRREAPLYFGDFPDDSLRQSMIGYVNEISVTPLTNEAGVPLDTIQEEQLFLDLTNDDADYEVFRVLQEAGVMTGSNGYLKPDAILNRAEMLKILSLTYELDLKKKATKSFWDVPTDAWYNRYVATAEAAGMIQGYPDGRFLPGHAINRAEFFTMLYRLAGEPEIEFYDEYEDVSENDWFAPAALYSHQNHFYYDIFEPTALVTRREAAQILYELVYLSQ